MTDFYPMVLAAVSKLDPNTEEARRALYQRARAALADRLRDLEPPLSEQRITDPATGSILTRTDVRRRTP